MQSKILTINSLLEEQGLDLSRTKLVRHAAGSHKIDMFGAWLHRRLDFEQYQSFQSKPRFDEADHIASFVADRNGQTVFVGVYEVRGKLDTPVGTVEVLTGNVVKLHYILYDVVLTEALDTYRGRLLVDWGKGTIAWVQAGTYLKPIVEIRRYVSEPPFPGYRRFTAELADVPRMPSSWRAALEDVTGVYLLTHKPSGRLYVGCAHGAEGFYSRWLKHATDPDPVGLKGIGAAELTVSILELSDPHFGAEEPLAAEARWKCLLRPALNLN